MSNESDWIVVYPSRWKALFQLFLSLSVLACLIAVFVSNDRAVQAQVVQLDAIHRFVLYFACPLAAGLCAATALYRLATRKPILVINDEGVFYRSSPLVSCVLRWEEIRRVEVYPHLGDTILRFVPVDAVGLLAQQGFFGRLESVNVSREDAAGLFEHRWPFGRQTTSRKPGGVSASVTIGQRLLPVKVADVAEQIKQRYGARFQSVPETDRPETR
jgi:hypothetical protein